MFNKKTFAITAITGLLLTGGFAFAQGLGMSLDINGDGAAKIKGTVTAVSGTTVTMTSWGGTWTVNAVNAAIRGDGNTTLTLADVKAGDTVVVSGTASQTGLAITAKTIAEVNRPQSNPNERVAIGVIANLNGSVGTFDIQPKFLFLNTSGNVAIATNSSTKVSLDGKTSTVSALSNALGVIVSGTWNDTTKVLTATSVRAFSSASFGWNGNGLSFGEKVRMGLGLGMKKDR